MIDRITRSPTIDFYTATGRPGDACGKARQVLVILVTIEEDKTQQEDLWLVVDVIGRDWSTKKTSIVFLCLW